MSLQRIRIIVGDAGDQDDVKNFIERTCEESFVPFLMCCVPLQWARRLMTLFSSHSHTRHENTDCNMGEQL